MADAMKPGATQLTVIWRLANSCASALLIAVSPPLEAA